MFKGQYQNGPAFEVFSAQGSNPLVNWKVLTSSMATSTSSAAAKLVKKEYDSSVKGYCFSVCKTGRLQLPKDDRVAAYLLQTNLTLQVQLPAVAQPFAVELCITDLQNNKRRLFLNTQIRELKVTPLHASIPLLTIKRGNWLILCFDILSILAHVFPGTTFRSLDQIVLSGTFKLRRVFTLRSSPADNTQGELKNVRMDANGLLNIDVIPRNLQYTVGVENYTQVITWDTIKESLGQSVSGSQLTSNAPTVTQQEKRPVQLAFGRRIEVPLPPPGKKKQNITKSEIIANEVQLARQNMLERAVSTTSSGIGPSSEHMNASLPSVDARGFSRASSVMTNTLKTMPPTSNEMAQAEVKGEEAEKQLDSGKLSEEEERSDTTRTPVEATASPVTITQSAPPKQSAAQDDDGGIKIKFTRRESLQGWSASNSDAHSVDDEYEEKHDASDREKKSELDVEKICNVIESIEYYDNHHGDSDASTANDNAHPDEDEVVEDRRMKDDEQSHAHQFSIRRQFMKRGDTDDQNARPKSTLSVEDEREEQQRRQAIERIERKVLELMERTTRSRKTSEEEPRLTMSRATRTPTPESSPQFKPIPPSRLSNLKLEMDTSSEEEAECVDLRRPSRESLGEPAKKDLVVENAKDKMIDDLMKSVNNLRVTSEMLLLDSDEEEDGLEMQKGYQVTSTSSPIVSSANTTKDESPVTSRPVSAKSQRSDASGVKTSTTVGVLEIDKPEMQIKSNEHDVDAKERHEPSPKTTASTLSKAVDAKLDKPMIIDNPPKSIDKVDEQQNVAIAAEDDEDETIELEYDEDMNCYFDPATGKYYEVVEGIEV